MTAISSKSDGTSVSLLARARGLDVEAWNKIVDLYGPMVYAWARSAGLQDADAADVTQDTFTAVSADLVQFRRDRPGDSFRGWLYTIARNKIRDHFRRAKKNAHVLAHEQGQDFLLQTEQKGLDVAVLNDPDEIARLKQRALNLIRPGFSDSQWQAFWLVAIDGEAPRDVAEQLEMSLASVYQAKSRVMRRLRSELEDLLDF